MAFNGRDSAGRHISLLNANDQAVDNRPTVDNGPMVDSRSTVDNGLQVRNGLATMNCATVKNSPAKSRACERCRDRHEACIDSRRCCPSFLTADIQRCSPGKSHLACSGCESASISCRGYRPPTCEECYRNKKVCYSDPNHQLMCVLTPFISSRNAFMKMKVERVVEPASRTCAHVSRGSDSRQNQEKRLPMDLMTADACRILLGGHGALPA